MENNVRYIVHWTPRVLGILGILLISMFAFDAFCPQLTFWQQIAGFLIHLIPSLVLTGILILAWYFELAGGIIFAVIGLGTLPWIFVLNYGMNGSIWTTLGVVSLINLPFIVTGFLFILSHFLKKKNKADITPG